MQTAREALLAIYRGEMPDFLPNERACTQTAIFPGERSFTFGKPFDPYGTDPDAWGVLWTNQGPDPGLDGQAVAAGFRLFDDVESWKDYVKFPDLSRAGDILRGMARNFDRENKVTSCLMLSGAFERLNQMVGMENALCAFYECPDELHEYYEAMCEYKLKCIDITWEAIQPDIIHMHDDWGTSNNMFFSPALWREFIKPHEARLAERIHGYGMLYEHHSCGCIQQIIPDLVEIGVDCINPLNICNDVAAIKREYGQRITLKGGVDNQRIDSGMATEEEIRAEARRVLDAYAPGGRYLPNYIASRADVQAIFYDEVQRYGAGLYRR